MIGGTSRHRTRGDPRRYRSAIAALVVADVAFAFLQTAVIPALPTIERDLNASASWTAWLLTAYLMLAVVMTPAVGKLGDQRGRQQMLLIALLVFLAGSVGAALSTELWILIVFRAVQGIGGAIFPLTFAVVRDEVPSERVGTVIGVLTGAFGIGTALGFGLGGLIAQALSWRMIFGCGAFAVALGVVTIALLVPRSPTTRRTHLDLAGAALLGATAIALLLALTLAPERGWSSAPVIALFIGAFGLGALWLRCERHADDPLVDLRVVGVGPVLLVNLATIAVGYALFGGYFLLPHLVEASARGYGFGASPTLSGLYLLPAAIGQLVMGPVSGRLTRQLPGRSLFGAGLVLDAIALALLAFAHAQPWEVLLASLLLGAGAGLAIQTSSTLVTQGVAAEQTAVSTALNSTVRRFAGGVGGQVSAALLAAFPGAAAAAPSAFAFTVAFGTAGALCLAGAALVGLAPAANARQ